MEFTHQERAIIAELLNQELRRVIPANRLLDPRQSAAARKLSEAYQRRILTIQGILRRL